MDENSEKINRLKSLDISIGGNEPKFDDEYNIENPFEDNELNYKLNKSDKLKKKDYLFIFLVISFFILFVGLIIALIIIYKLTRPDDKCYKHCIDCKNDICKSCSSGFILMDNKCLDKSYSFIAIYSSNEGNKEIQLINDKYKQYIKVMKNEKEYENENYIISKYSMESPGDIIFYFNIDLENIDSISGIFQNIMALKYISFTNFDSKKIANISYMFQNCENLLFIEFINFI